MNGKQYTGLLFFAYCGLPRAASHATYFLREAGVSQRLRTLHRQLGEQAEFQHRLLFLLAEAVGFEPTNGYPLLVFKTSAFNHSATLPLAILQQISRPLP